MRVAACWEFIIPGRGMEIPNIDAPCFADIMRDAVTEHLADAPDYESLFRGGKEKLQARVDEMCGNTKTCIFSLPLPFPDDGRLPGKRQGYFSWRRI